MRTVYLRTCPPSYLRFFHFPYLWSQPLQFHARSYPPSVSVFPTVRPAPCAASPHFPSSEACESCDFPLWNKKALLFNEGETHKETIRRRGWGEERDLFMPQWQSGVESLLKEAWVGFNVVTDTAAWGQEESGLVKTLAVQDNTGLQHMVCDP